MLAVRNLLTLVVRLFPGFSARARFTKTLISDYQTLRVYCPGPGGGRLTLLGASTAVAWARGRHQQGCSRPSSYACCNMRVTRKCPNVNRDGRKRVAAGPPAGPSRRARRAAQEAATRGPEKAGRLPLQSAVNAPNLVRRSAEGGRRHAADLAFAQPLEVAYGLHSSPGSALARQGGRLPVALAFTASAARLQMSALVRLDTPSSTGHATSTPIAAASTRKGCRTAQHASVHRCREAEKDVAAGSWQVSRFAIGQ